MTPADLRNLTWDSLQPLLSGQRLAVLSAWRGFGQPMTTAGAAIIAKISILTFRPRTTELVQVGLIELVDQCPHSTEGLYRAVPADRARTAFEAARAAAPQAHQTFLPL